ncbi:protein transport protein SEC16A [Hordeum vulgare]|nr:protein transport protein SEC16A [Hordeum vulgare]
MGSDSDDADFFDKLVDDDDDDASRPPPAAKSHAAAEDAAAAADLAALTLDDADDGTGGAPEPEPQPAAASPEPQAEAEAPVAPPQADALTATPDAEVLPSLPEVEAAAPDAEVPAALPEVKEEAPNDEVPAGLPDVKAVAAPDPEGRSPGSGSGSGSSKGVRTSVKQVQWSLFGADISSGTEPDPFSDLLADSAGDPFLGAGDPFLGAAVGAQVSGFGATTVGAVDHSFYNGVASSNASSQLGWGAGSGEFLADGHVGEDTFFGVQGSAVGTAGSVAADDHSFFNGVDGNASSHSYMGAGVVESADLQNTVAQSDWTGGAVDPSDPYPGWKWDVATGQWYQVDTIGAQGFADNNAGAAAAVGGENVQQQQHLGVSYLQNSSQAGLETITEEASAAAATWGQDQSSAAAAEYPPNMLFYAEYPEHYYDSNTQQWFTLESYQQSVVQAATPASALDAFAGEGHGVVHTGNTQASSFNQQNQWQHGLLANSMQPYTENQISQPAYTEPLKPSTNYGTAINTFMPSLETSTTNYQNNINTFVPSTSQYSGSGEGHQVSNKGFQPTSYQSAAHKGFEPYKNNQSAINTFLPSTTQYNSSGEGHQVSNKGFQPTSYHNAAHKGFEPYKNNQSAINTFLPSTTQYNSSGEGHQVSNKGFEPTSSQSAHKGFEPYKINQSTSASHDSGSRGFEPSTVHQGFKPFTNNQRSTGFVPSSSHQIAHKEFEPPKDNQAHHVAHQSSSGHGYDYPNGFVEPQKSVPVANMYQMQTQTDAGAHMHLPNNYVSTENSMSFPQQLAPSQQLGYSHHEERSSAGRPPHSLVAFGFGGKLVVMKETSSMTTNFDSGNQGNSQGTVSILNISEVVADKINQQGIPSSSALSYFYALCRRPIPGPLAGGSAAAKDLNKWLDDIIGGYESSVSDFQGGDVQKLLISLLKISYQHYGKLRSPFGPDPSREGMDGPDTAVTALFSSCNSNSARMRDHCMKNIPSENQIQATAQEVQNLLVSGRRKEALQYAQEGQLWGPALILALQLGDQFYADTVKKMAYCHFKSGSPLRTLCLLIAGQPADVLMLRTLLMPIMALYIGSNSLQRVLLWACSMTGNKIWQL